ncbi:MFS-type transporter SLC18B1 [Ixodes scapularis]|uniref:MFS-type transporter SLC18B1 n=1 Tax=Ixodes scapularis TaxID=6945 RepID=UPI001A9D744D|nr:MFS-type transporter SLC18B1 [Ixodes scapularis]
MQGVSLAYTFFPNKTNKLFESSLLKYCDASLVADLQQPAAADMPFGRLLRDSLFILNTFSVMLSWVIMGFNEPTLGPYLEQFGLSNTEVGVCFMVQYASYAVGSLISGMFCQFQMEIFFNFASLLLTALSFMIIGPVPFLPCQPSLWMLYVSLVLMGNGMAALFVCSYCQALRRATELGYPDNLRTSGFVSSVLFPSLVIGGLATSPIAGYLVDTFGYRKGSMFMFVTLLTWGTIISLECLEMTLKTFQHYCPTPERYDHLFDYGNL